jgi:hypothetical protein
MRHLRMIAGSLALAVLLGVTGCGPTVQSQSRYEPAPPVSRPATPQERMSARNKVLVLAGAAALYYLYQKHKNAQGQGPEGQYYRSKNGRVYYRDARGGVHWVTPPQQLEVPVDEYERATGRRIDNYDGRVIRDAPAGWS